MPAPIYKRLFALLYDSLLVLAILFVATFLALLINKGESYGPNHFGFLTYLISSASFYFLWCWTKSGQTLGMKAWKLKLKTCSLNRLTLKQASLRLLCGTFCLLFFGIGLLWCLFDKNKQSLADRLCDTKTICT